MLPNKKPEVENKNRKHSQRKQKANRKRKKLERQTMENRKFICFVPLFSSALILLIFTLLNRFPFFLKDFFMEALFTARN